MIRYFQLSSSGLCLFHDAPLYGETEARYGRSMRRSVLILLFLLLTGNPVAKLQAQPVSAPARPGLDTLALGTRIPDEQLAKKKEGRSIALLPGAGSNPDFGFVAAAMAAWYENGSRSDPRFAYAPYQYAIVLLSSLSTKGVYSLRLNLDVPYVNQTFYRIRAGLAFTRNPAEPWYGEGADALGPLSTPRGDVYDRYKDYRDELIVANNGRTDSYYNLALIRQVSFTGSIERSLFDGRIRASFGGALSHIRVEDYTGKEVPARFERPDGVRIDAVMDTTKLLSDHVNGRITGFDGGWRNGIRAGVAFDTRDLEVNPRSGVFHDLLFYWTPEFLGTEDGHGMASTSLRFYTRPIRPLDVVLGARIAYSARWGPVPFHALDHVAVTDKSITGLGGEGTLRGFRQNRFVGKHLLFGNIELRYILFTLRRLGYVVEPILVPFFEFGNVYDTIGDTSLRGFKKSYGMGVRFAVNQAFVIAFDVGFSGEDDGLLYVTFGHIF